MKEAKESLNLNLNPKDSLLEVLSDENIGGVQFKNLYLKKKIISYFANEGNATIAELGKLLNTSTPKITLIIGELINDNLVKDYGKIETNGGRRPNIYGLIPDSVFFMGVEIKNYHINIGLIDFKKKMVKTTQVIPYELTNTPEALDRLCLLIQNFIKQLPIKPDKIWGIGINLTGRINFNSGYSYSYFHFSEEPLKAVIEKRVGIRTYIENDSRAMAFGEFSSGIVRDEKNVLFINMDYGIGLGIMIAGEVYYGKSGFAGEFGHIPIFENEVICHCGKKGCLETVASGWALIKMFTDKLKEGSSSILSDKLHDPEEIKLEDIIDAAQKEDVLAIQLIGKIGENMGRGIAVLINLFNPELIILGGSLAATGDYIKLPIRSSINKYSLSLVNNDTQLKTSSLGNLAGVIGASLLVRNNLLNL